MWYERYVATIVVWNVYHPMWYERYVALCGMKDMQPMWYENYVATCDITDQTYPTTLCFTICVMPQFHCAKSTAERGRIDCSCSVGGLLLVILAMTLTMTINSNSVLLVHVTSLGQHKKNMFKTFVFPMHILFILGYVHWKCVVIFFVAQLKCCILVILTLYYVIHACNISQENSAK